MTEEEQADRSLQPVEKQQGRGTLKEVLAILGARNDLVVAGTMNYMHEWRIEDHVDDVLRSAVETIIVAVAPIQPLFTPEEINAFTMSLLPPRMINRKHDAEWYEYDGLQIRRKSEYPLLITPDLFVNEFAPVPIPGAKEHQVREIRVSVYPAESYAQSLVAQEAAQKNGTLVTPNDNINLNYLTQSALKAIKKDGATRKRLASPPSQLPPGR